MTFQNSQVRFYVSLIGSGKGRHTTHLLKCVLLHSTSQTDWKQSSDILSDIYFDMRPDTSSDILSDISKTKHSTHSFKQRPLHKLYIYLTPRSKSNIHHNFVSVKWQFYSCIRLHRTAPPRSSWVQRCKAPAATHTPRASDSPANKAVESQDAMQVSTQPQLHLMACANHEDACASCTSSV